MDTITTATGLEVLTDEEMARVVGGAETSKVSVQEVGYRIHRLCGCGREH